MIKRLLIHSILPTFFGGIIYVLFRDDSIYLIRLLKNNELLKYLQPLRSSLYINNDKIPNWIYFSLPDGLWIYGLISSYFIVLKNKVEILFWIIVSIGLSVGVEFLQKSNLYKGTFDWVDILFYVLGIIFSVFINLNKLQKNEEKSI